MSDEEPLSDLEAKHIPQLSKIEELPSGKGKMLLKQMSEAFEVKVDKAIIVGFGVKEGAPVIIAPVIGDFTSLELVKLYQVAHGVILSTSDVALEDEAAYIATA